MSITLGQCHTYTDVNFNDYRYFVGVYIWCNIKYLAWSWYMGLFKSAI